MISDVFWGLLFPVLGTTAGAACVFFMRGEMDRQLQRALMGFASGVMVAASVWSLLLPSIEMSKDMGHWAFIPAVIGFGLGMLFLFELDHFIPHLHLYADKAEGPKKNLQKTTMLVLAVTLHNIPEGMATGIVYVGVLLHPGDPVYLAAAGALSLGIGIQNIPEGAIISMPLRSVGMGSGKAFAAGTMSGLVEPIAAVTTIALASVMTAIVPYCLSFAAGAMLFVTVEELIPEMSAGEHSDVGVMLFAVGFMLMMSLDVSLG